MPSNQLDNRAEADGGSSVLPEIPPTNPDDAQVLDLQQQLVSQVKTAAAATAEAARLRQERDRFEQQRDRARDRAERLKEKVDELRAQRDRLAAELDAVRNSETWRIGNAFVRPLARLVGRRPDAGH